VLLGTLVAFRLFACSLAIESALFTPQLEAAWPLFVAASLSRILNILVPCVALYRLLLSQRNMPNLVTLDSFPVATPSLLRIQNNPKLMARASSVLPVPFVAVCLLRLPALALGSACLRCRCLTCRCLACHCAWLAGLRLSSDWPHMLLSVRCL
jgi:hypothetical protein